MTFELFCRRAYCRLVRYPARWYYFRQFQRAFAPPQYKAYWVVDIDNTIAHTWVKMTPQARVDSAQLLYNERLMSIEPLEGMRQVLAQKPHDTQLIFLTARSYDVHWVTKRWLQKHGFWQADARLILVDRMVLKADFFEKILKNMPDLGVSIPEKHENTPPQYPVTFFDDLSFNHENGTVQFYEEAITRITRLPLNYIGYSELLTINFGKN